MSDMHKYPGMEQSRKRYIEILRRMTGEQRVKIAFELFEMAKNAMIDGMKAQNPDITEEEIQKEVVRRMMRCHRRNYLERLRMFSND